MNEFQATTSISWRPEYIPSAYDINVEVRRRQKMEAKARNLGKDFFQAGSSERVKSLVDRTSGAFYQRTDVRKIQALHQVERYKLRRLLLLKFKLITGKKCEMHSHQVKPKKGDSNFQSLTLNT